MYTYQELCEKEIILFKTGKFQQDIEDFFYELNVIGYLEENRVNIKSKEVNGKKVLSADGFSVSANELVVVCDFNQAEYRSVMDSFSFVYMEDYIFGMDLIRLLDDVLRFEHGEKIEGKKIVLWGTGKRAEGFLLQNLNYDVSYVVDNNQQKWGDIFYGKPICNPEKLRDERNGDFVVVCASMHVFEINVQLADMGLSLNTDYFFWHDNKSSSKLLVKTIMSDPKKLLGCMGENILQIQSDGNVYLCCCGFLGHIPQGNLFCQSFEDIEKSVAVRLYALSLINKTYSLCNGTCSALYFYNQKAYQPANKPVLRDNKNTTINLCARALHPTYDYTCNLRCITCREDKITRICDADKSRIDEVHRKVVEITGKFNSLAVSGSGDAVYSRYYTDLIFNHFKGQNLMYLTNGILFNEQYWKKLHQKFGNADTNIFVEVSVDAATKETYEMIRGGDFDVLLNNLQMMSALRKQNQIKTLSINFTVELYNFREILDFIKFGQRFGVDFVKFTNMANWRHTDEEFKNMNVFSPEHEFYEELCDIFDDPLYKQAFVQRVF